jgi:hypothetical protein
MRRDILAVSFLAAGVIALALGSAAGGTTASRSQIAVHVQGNYAQYRNVISNTRGTFTIKLALSPAGAGTSLIGAQIAPPKTVGGQVQFPISGTDTLTSKTGQLVLAFKGLRIGVNRKLSSSGGLVGSVTEYGTWKITAAAGTYQGWKGGGNWTSIYYGYARQQPYSIEWDGYVVTP